MPFPGSDRSVMMRTQRSRFHVDTERPAQARVARCLNCGKRLLHPQTSLDLQSKFESILHYGPSSPNENGAIQLDCIEIGIAIGSWDILESDHSWCLFFHISCSTSWQPCAQVHCYFTISGLFSAFMIMLGGLMFGTLAKFKFGRSLLEDYPRYTLIFNLLLLVKTS